MRLLDFPRWRAFSYTHLLFGVTLDGARCWTGMLGAPKLPDDDPNPLMPSFGLGELIPMPSFGELAPRRSRP